MSCPQVQSPVWESRAQVAIPAMCGVYVVQVSCVHIEGSGYRSEWSDSVYSSPHNSRSTETHPFISGELRRKKNPILEHFPYFLLIYFLLYSSGAAYKKNNLHSF